ncbi:hypothetical protein [Streptomyces sp. NPDC017993]|uniref:hypothetical protein n=1 Tax=Streptomyces sp. NPDC017993 TaxID=3365027 RepID=UPI00379DF0B1
MPMPRPAPALDGTVVPTGRRKLKARLLTGLSLTALGLAAAIGLLLMAFGVLESEKGPVGGSSLVGNPELLRAWSPPVARAGIKGGTS